MLPLIPNNHGTNSLDLSHRIQEISFQNGILISLGNIIHFALLRLMYIAIIQLYSDYANTVSVYDKISGFDQISRQ